MLINCRELPPGTTLEADLCIIGAGPAGITVARALRGTGRSVLLLESGGFEPHKATNRLMRGGFRGSFWPRGRFPYMTTTRMRGFGGTSGHWNGYVRPLDPIDFEQRDWMPGSGWPFGYSALHAYYVRAAEAVEVTPFPTRDPHGQPLPTPGLFRNDPELTEQWFHFSPPTRFGETYRAELVDDPDIKVALWGNVVRIVRASNGRAVERLACKVLEGPAFTVKARRYVLAAGGIETPRLMLASGGLGNDRDLVGRYFCDHPHVTIGFASVTGRHGALRRFRKQNHRRLGHRIMPVVVPTAAAQRAHRLCNAGVQLIRTRKARPGSEWMRALRGVVGPDKSSERVLYARFEQAPNRDSRVYLGRDKDRLGVPRAQLGWWLSSDDRQRIIRVMELIARRFGAAGLGHVYANLLTEGAWPKRSLGGCHHMGTARMHPDPARGVVDADCKVHGIDNLWLAGSAVFPTGGAANPTLTLIALAYRLAEHLEQAR